MKGSSFVLSKLVLRIALACFLIATGILTLQLDAGFFGKLQAGFAGNEIANAVHSLFKGDLANMLIMLLGLLSVIAGAFLVVGFFANTGSFNKIALLVIMVLWIVIIFLVDIVGKGGIIGGAFNSMATFLSFLKILSAHLLVLGAIMSAMEA
ncbi:MAG TPA: hypothetical protein VJ861_12125 [Treponemataceae bacterium]|nr:hypothetical protein [Treponemataceae bacterium]